MQRKGGDGEREREIIRSTSYLNREVGIFLFVFYMMMWKDTVTQNQKHGRLASCWTYARYTE